MNTRGTEDRWNDMAMPRSRSARAPQQSEEITNVLESRDMQVSILDVYRGQKVSLMEGNSDVPGGFNAKCVGPKK